MATIALAEQADYGLPHTDRPLLTEGAIGSANVGPNGEDLRITDFNVSGPYPLVDGNSNSLYDTYGGSPVHRFYQMWQELDCDAKVAAAKPTINPSGCQNDLFPWVEQTVSSGGNGGPPPQHEGNIAMGFYNVAKGDMPYFTQLANQYTINDNYHQPVMGGTYANMPGSVFAQVSGGVDSTSVGLPLISSKVLKPIRGDVVYAAVRCPTGDLLPYDPIDRRLPDVERLSYVPHWTCAIFRQRQGA